MRVRCHICDYISHFEGRLDILNNLPLVTWNYVAKKSENIVRFYLLKLFILVRNHKKKILWFQIAKN